MDAEALRGFNQSQTRVGSAEEEDDNPAGSRRWRELESIFATKWRSALVAAIEVGAEKFRVHAMPIPKGAERDRLYEAHGDVFAGFRDYPKRTKRVIPVVVLQRVR
jgi:hypothetical protein